MSDGCIVCVTATVLGGPETSCVRVEPGTTITVVEVDPTVSVSVGDVTVTGTLGDVTVPVRVIAPPGMSSVMVYSIVSRKNQSQGEKMYRSTRRDKDSCDNRWAKAGACDKNRRPRKNGGGRSSTHSDGRWNGGNRTSNHNDARASLYERDHDLPWD